jgi:mannose-6-phosphate isomerase-like protein (cupin superfamily)
MGSDRARAALVRYPRVTLTPDADGRRNGCATITDHDTDDPGTAWTDVAIHEWELEDQGWEDLHPHDETTYLLAGELVIESDGVSVTLRPGDAAVVRGGHLGRQARGGPGAHGGAEENDALGAHAQRDGEVLVRGAHRCSRQRAACPRGRISHDRMPT